MEPIHALPHSLEAEQYLLGALLVKPAAFMELPHDLKPEHFYAPVHGRLYALMSAMTDKQEQWDAASLAHHFRDDPDLEERGGAQYLFDLAGSCVLTVAAPNYAKLIRNTWQLREIVSLCTTARELTMGFDAQPEDILAEIEKGMTNIVSTRSAQIYTSANAVDRTLAYIERLRNGGGGIKTGIPTLDDKINGLHGGALYILAGRPAMGKTALALSISDNISATTPILMCSLEMPVEELTMRLIAGRTAIPVSVQRSDRVLNPVQTHMILEAAQDIRGRHMTIEDTSGVSVHHIKALARRHKRKYGRFVLVIDYLGLIAVNQKTQNKVHQIEEITVNLKWLAKELDIPVLLLSQLSRALEQRQDKRPMLSDLRDSGAIEQDADVVMFVYRDCMYRKEAAAPMFKGGPMPDQHDTPSDAAEVIIGKNRQGETGTAHMSFDGNRQRFYS